MKKVVSFLAFLFLASINYPLQSQNFDGIIGAFEYSGDRQIYVSYYNSANDRFLSKRVEGYLSTDVLVTTLEAPVGLVYSNQYQRLFAIYRSSNQRYIAHSIHRFVELGSGKAIAGFGIAYDAGNQRLIAAYLNESGEIIGFPVE